jgi:hypothetical protein
MCMACEQQADFYREYFGAMLKRGVMPEGIDPADLEDLGLEIPPELMFALGRKSAPARMPEPQKPAANPFNCDNPDDE